MTRKFIIAGSLLALIGIAGAMVAGRSEEKALRKPGPPPSPSAKLRKPSTSRPDVKNVNQPDKGFFEGSVVFPSEGIPRDLRVCAVNLDTTREYCVRKLINAGRFKQGRGYRLAVPAGKYQVYAVSPSFDPGYQAFYTAFVVCGYEATCADHSPITVSLRPGQTRRNIEPGDFYDN